MRKLVYYVATSLDGYIAGPGESIDLFAMNGPLVERYKQDLQGFDTVIMGRKTYEFGYKFGLPPGQPAYPHMRHYIFSDSLTLENPHNLVKVVKRSTTTVQQLKQEEGTNIYLCGGGAFAGWLLDEKLIDILKIKFNPIILGGGTPLFGGSSAVTKLNQIDNQEFEGGLSLRTYHIQY
ncbi:MAG: dihydrofolate reductase family protein [Tunicatimonas sp.]|uniref:dihydrofolate reductase family protein n=1 Tax=Tunicatimonas sp. TaxID=1940096 RepID=UPI003C734373